MAEDTQVVETTPSQGTETNVSQNDPFALDDNSLVSLSPEQRASLDPIIDGWKKKANEEISKRDSEITKYKSYSEKATALDKLTQYAPFVQWWQQEQLKGQAQAQTPAQAQAIAQAKPQDIATQEEWQNAIYLASQGDGSKLAEIQSRLMTTVATPLYKELKEKQDTIDAKLELANLFENHPDAKELDMIGVDPKTKEGKSLLEVALEVAQDEGKPLEYGYQLARKWSDSMRVSAQQQAMGMVQEKKQSVVQSPSTTSANKNVVEVEDRDELIKRSMEAQLSGNKETTFVIRKK